jgi:hypothetical protein
MNQLKNNKTKQPCTEGSHGKYSKGCRCQPCTVAHRIYSRNRKRLRKQEEYGLLTLDPLYVDATEAREHLIFLAKHNIGLDYINFKTGISKSNLQRLKRGQNNILPKNAKKILAIPAIAKLDGQYMSSVQAKKMMDKMLKAGYKQSEIAKAYDGRTTSIRLKKYVRKYKHDKIKEIYDVLMSPHILKARKK